MSAELTFEKFQRDMAARLSAAGIQSADLDARLLLQNAGNFSPTELAVNAKQRVPGAVAVEAARLMAQRLTGRPVSKIFRRREFWGRLFISNEAVLDPRPDSETLIAAILEKLPTDARFSFLDMGTGSACLALTLLAERPKARGVAIDKSRAALSVARRNAHRLGLRDRIALRCSDWFANVHGRFDLIMSNPPYIETAAMAGLAPEVRLFDPPLALDGGPDGLAPYRELTRRAAAHLKPRGYLAFELGADQADAVEGLMAAARFLHIERFYDLAGHARVLVGQKPE